MLDFSSARIDRLAIMWIGNKNRYEGTTVPKQLLVPPSDIAEELLLPAMLRPFEKSEEFFNFHHEDDLSLNKGFRYTSAIFESSDNFEANAYLLGQHLYECSDNSRIQGGEFFVAHFRGLYLDGEPVSGIGMWKIQGHDNFLKTERSDQQFVLNVSNGISTEKLECAALIIDNSDMPQYRVNAIDTVSKKDERSFWKDEFLRIRPVEDNYFHTRHYISIAAEFIDQKGAVRAGMTAIEQLGAMNTAREYFLENDEFERTDFATQVFKSEEAREKFEEFVDEYRTAYALNLEDAFDISRQAVKKEKSRLKTVLKLDKNFVLTVNTSRTDLIERGFDTEAEMTYYKVYFNNEA